MTSTIFGELMAMVLPSASSTLAPKHQAMDQKVVCASIQWLIWMPTGWPIFFSFLPALAHLAELGLEVVARNGRPDRLEPLPVAVDEKRFLAERVDVGAVLLVELSHDVVQVHQVVAVAPGMLVVE